MAEFTVPPELQPLLSDRSGDGWVFRRRLAIIRAMEADPQVQAAERAMADIDRLDIIGRLRLLTETMAVRSQVMDRYDLPPYPSDGGYWSFRLRDLLGLTRKPPG